VKKALRLTNYAAARYPGGATNDTATRYPGGATNDTATRYPGGVTNYAAARCPLVATRCSLKPIGQTCPGVFGGKRAA